MKIYIETLGCPKNANDSQSIGGILKEAGHTLADQPLDADGIIVNTCGFINDAKVESINCIFEMMDYGKLLIVSGCLSQRYGDQLFEEMPEVDIFLGVNDYNRLPEILDNHIKGQRQQHTSQYQGEEISSLRNLGENPYSATLKVSEGCDNWCTYCIIPKIRGPYRSRPMEDIIEEANDLAAKGVKELILIAQDTTAYGIDLYGDFVLDQLVEKLCQIDGLHWIRLMYCYEDRITDRLIEVMAREPKVCKYLDMPLQHCSDNVLKAMKRRSTSKSIDQTISKLRSAMEDIHLRTTLIVGFPGEEEEDFNKLVDFVEDTRFERLGVFSYSAEEGTVAANMENQVEDGVKEQRKDAIMNRQIDISLKSNQSKVGKTLEVLVEGQEEEDVYFGRTMYDAPEIDNAVIFKTKDKLNPGQFVKVKITDAFDYDLIGETDEFTK